MVGLAGALGVSIPTLNTIVGGWLEFSVRAAGERQCPARDFLEEIESRMVKRFDGQFHALTILGADYCNYERFKNLAGEGKPLWEFKEHAHRWYCLRQVAQGCKVVTIFYLMAGLRKKGERPIRENRNRKSKSVVPRISG